MAARSKASLRTELRAVRRTIAGDPVERSARSARIWAAIVPRLDLGGRRLGSETRAARIMLFESLPGEPDTAEWAAWCRDRGWEVLHPEVDGPSLRVQPGDVDPGTLDVVVVPGLAFTPDGHRLGQGGGHYDRFLTRLRPGCLTIGVCFREQLVAELPVEAHDVPLTAVVTDADHDR
jgi:5-formyltetrahydrofolate cyclo-ligase